MPADSGFEIPLSPKPTKEMAALVSTAEPPEEVVAVLNEHPLPPGAIRGWFAVPSLPHSDHRLSTRELQTQGQVDAVALLEPLLGNRVFDRTLRTVDVLNGCGHQCDTCLADAAVPSRIFNFDSLARLFSDERFLAMLQPDSLRFGSSGDIIDHPQAMDIIQTALAATEPLDRQLAAATGKRHRIKLLTNYRPHTEAITDELIELALQQPERVMLALSLPLNRKDTVNERFVQFAARHPGIFGNRTIGADGLLDVGMGGTLAKNIVVQDVRHAYPLFMSGRVLSDEARGKKVARYSMEDPDRKLSFADRGLAKTYLNPDALWLMVYATSYESHTARAFTPLTPENSTALGYVPYHPDFPTPPNWPGGRGELKPSGVAAQLRVMARLQEKAMKPVTVIPSLRAK